MAFTEDLTEFLDTAYGFAVTATYNGSTSVNGIFDAEYFEPDAGFAGIQSAQPVFLCRTVDVASAAHGQTLVVASVNYKIVGVEPDGTGMTLLKLEKQ